MQAFPSRISFEGSESYRMQFVIRRREAVPSSMMQRKRGRPPAAHTSPPTPARRTARTEALTGGCRPCRAARGSFPPFPRGWKRLVLLLPRRQAGLPRPRVTSVNNRHGGWLDKAAVQKGGKLTADPCRPLGCSPLAMRGRWDVPIYRVPVRWVNRHPGWETKSCKGKARGQKIIES